MSKSIKVVWGVLVGMALLYGGVIDLQGPARNASRGWTTILTENFESGVIPSTWTVIDGNNDGIKWTAGTTSDLSGYEPPNYGTAYAYYSDDDAGNNVINTYEAIISPSLYIGAAESLKIQYGYGFRVYQTGETYEFGVRFFKNGSWGSWTNLKTYTTSTSGTETVNLSSNLPADSVQFRWYYHDESSSSHWGWACGLDNVSVQQFLAVSHDVGTEAILSPAGTVLIGSTVDVKVKFKNYGLNTETFPVHVEIIDPNSQLVFSKDSSLTLNPNQSVDVIFGQWTAITEGLHKITAYTALTGDQYPANDTLTQLFNVSVWSSWNPYSPPSVNADRLTHATVYDFDNDRIYMIGGTPNGQAGSNVNYNYRYNPVTNTWETNLAGMPDARGWIQGAYWNGKIYIPGGYTNSQTVANTFYIYDIASNTWTQGPALPEGRLAHGTVAWNGNIFVVGGVRPNLTQGSQTVYRYNISTGTWTTATQIPLEFDMGGVTIIGNRIYIVGGVRRSASAAWTNLYEGVIDTTNPDNITWNDLGPLPYPNAINAACALPGRIYMIGGFVNLQTATNRVWEYNIETGTWAELPSYVVPIVRNHFAVARPSLGGVGARIYVVAGDANGDWSPPNNYYYYLEAAVSASEKSQSLKPLVFSVKPFLSEGPLTVIFTLNEKSMVDLSIYNALGQKVATIFKGVKEKGTHTISWNGKLNSGIYFIKVNSPENYQVKKIIRVK